MEDHGTSSDGLAGLEAVRMRITGIRELGSGRARRWIVEGTDSHPAPVRHEYVSEMLEQNPGSRIAPGMVVDAVLRSSTGTVRQVELPLLAIEVEPIGYDAEDDSWDWGAAA